MAVFKFNKTNIDALGSVAQATYHRDTDLNGFFLRQMPTGVMAYGVEYRFGSGRGAPKRRITIAKTSKVTPEQARRIAAAKLAEVALGGDPAAEKAAKAREMTVKALIDLYEEEGCYVQKGKRSGIAMKPLTKKYTLARLRNHVVPLLGQKKLSELSVEVLERFFRDVATGKTACDRKAGPRTRVKVTGGEGAARKVFRDFSAVCSFAENRRYIERNLCKIANVNRTDNARDRYLSGPEMARIGDALEELRAEGVNSKALEIMLLWIFTGCRRDEIAGLRWSEVRLEGRQIELEDSKTGRSWRPIDAGAASILAGIKQDPGSPFVFPAERGKGHYQGAKRHWRKIMSKAELIGVTPHTLRHSLGARAASNGASLPQIASLLGHANPRSSARYAHVDRNPAVALADSVSATMLPLAATHLRRKSESA